MFVFAPVLSFLVLHLAVHIRLRRTGPVTGLGVIQAGVLGKSGGVPSEAQMGVLPVLMSSGNQLPAPHPTLQLLALCCLVSPLQGRRCLSASIRSCVWSDTHPGMLSPNSVLPSAVCCNVFISSVIGSHLSRFLPFPSHVRH